MIHDRILRHVQTELQTALIDSIPADDLARAGVVQLGPLQGNPDPDQARISVELYENDPDSMLGGALGNAGSWDDEVDEAEIGGSITWQRRFTVKARCLLANTQENLQQAREIASTVRHRIEKALLTMSFTGVEDEDEIVVRGAASISLHGEMVQSGGPDAYDYNIKIRFDVLTNERIGV